MITLAINALILVLLVGTIGYIYLVDMRVRKLLSALNSLEPMVGQFSEAVNRSETSLKDFKSATSPTKTAPQKTAPQKAKRTKEPAKGKSAENYIAFESDRKSLQTHVGRITLPGKTELVRSFFETARSQEL